WICHHPPRQVHPTPKHSSLVSLAECFFSNLTRRSMQHSVYHSKHQLKQYLRQFIDHYSESCSPFVWTKGPEQLQRIIESTKQYQAEHPVRRKRRRRDQHNIKH